MAATATQNTRSVARERRFCLTERDLELLGFIACHRFVLACQVQVWLEAHEAIAYRRLKGLVKAGLLVYERLFDRRPGCYRVTQTGLAVAEPELGRPMIDLRSYRHDVGLVWLWLAARARHPDARVLSERQMRSHDERLGRGETGFGIPVGDYAPSGKPRVHYPDVLIARPDGSRVAVELELSLKSRRRLEAILAAYRYQRSIVRVVYVTDSPVIAAAVGERGLLLGLDSRLRVHYLDRALGAPDRWVWQSIEAGEVIL